MLTIAASVGVTAANATSPMDTERTQVGPLITETSAFAGDPSTPTFSAPGVAGAGSEIPANRQLTMAAARAAAVRWSIPVAGETTTVRPMSAPALCVTAGSASINSYSPVTLESCVDGDPKQQFRLAANTGSNNPIGTGLQSTYNRGFLGLFNTDSVMRLQGQNVADRLPNTGDFVPSFSARVDAVDAPTRSADLSGTGTPGATVLIDGRRPQIVDQQGRWTARVTELPFGTSTLQLEQYEGNDRTGQLELEVDLQVTALTFEARFPTDRTAEVTASGTAQVGSEVKLFGHDGLQLGETVQTAADGSWSTTIPAPNAGGALMVTASQFIDNVRDTAHDVTRSVDYGAAVAISTPQDGAAHRSGPVAMAGTGEPGSAVEIVEVTADGERVVGRSPNGVLPNGRWDVETEDLDRAEHVLRAVQKSKGANTTVAEVTINPGESGRLTPVTVTGPSTVTPGVVNTITGTGEPGATFRVLNASGSQLVPGTGEVDADGRWSFQRAVSRGATKFEFVIEQTKGDQGPEPSQLFSIAANQGFAPVVVSTRSVDPGVTNTITGTGPAGATMQVLNASGNQIVPADVTVDQNGNWSFDRALSRGVTKFDFKFSVSVSGSEYTTSLYTIYANTR